MLRLCKSSLWFLQDSEIFVSMADQKIRENTVAWQYWISFSQSPKSNKGPLNWTLNWTLVTLFFCIKKSRLNTLDFLHDSSKLIWYQSQVISFLHCHYCHLFAQKKVAQFNPHRHFISSHKIKVSLLFFLLSFVLCSLVRTIWISFVRPRETTKVILLQPCKGGSPCYVTKSKIWSN